MVETFISPDGSPLAMYLALPAGDAPSIVHDAIGEDRSILELGSGPGRLTRVFVALGHRVSAVDDSEQMLEHVTGAERICADLFTLDLDRRFSVVLVASHLINIPGVDARRRLLEACRRHVDVGGLVIVERHTPGWLLECEPQSATAGPVSMSFEPGPLDGDVRSASMTYTLAGRSWRQEFVSEDVDDKKLARAAEDVGLVFDRVVDDDERWVVLTVA